MNDAQYEEWKPLVQRAARNVSRDFPDSETADLEQTIWEGLLLHQAKGKLMDPEAEYAETALIFLAKSQASVERKNHLTVSSQYAYRTADVRKLLETYFDRRDWYHAEIPEDAYSELGSVALEMSTDLSRAWDVLTRPHKTLIFLRFGLRHDVDSKKLSRAISRMADILNTYQPPKRAGGPGARKVLSNAHSNFIIANQDG